MNKPFVFSFLSTKGGVGKSTITFNLGCYFAKAFPEKKVIFGETDMQQPFKFMLDQFKDDNKNYPEVIFVGNCNTAADMRAKLKATDADFVFLDGVGVMNDVFSQSVLVSDFIIWMAGKSVKDIQKLPVNFETAHALGKSGAYLMNGVKRNESVYALCRETLKSDPAYTPYPLLENDIRDLSAYRIADVFGTPVVDMDSSAKNARDDLDSVAAEIFEMALKGA